MNAASFRIGRTMLTSGRTGACFGGVGTVIRLDSVRSTTVTPSSDFDREPELERIRAQYADYEQTGRYGLWDLRNPGFERLVRERDARLMELLRESIGSEGPVLDLGAGSGRLAGVARTSGVSREWVGVDIDESALEAARVEYPWAKFVVASADELPMADSSVGAVIASVLFSSLPSPEFEAAVASEIGRVLRPDGWLIWYDLRYDNPSNPGVHGLDLRAIQRLFSGWDIQLSTTSLLPPLARRLGPATPIAYPVLHAIPVLRSHLIGRLRPGA